MLGKYLGVESRAESLMCIISSLSLITASSDCDGLLYPHFTEGKTGSQKGVAQSPDYIAILVRADGVLGCL
jgi:hypothetical protein